MRMRAMEEAIAVLAHPQLLVAVAAVLLLSMALLIVAMAARQAWPQHPMHQPGPLDVDPSSLGPEAYDWLYE